MIQSFGDKETGLIWQGRYSSNFPSEIQSIARRKLRMLHNAQDLKDLRIPPANRLEKLAGMLKGFYNIRINQQWRIVFRWTAGNANEVRITDYH